MPIPSLLVEGIGANCNSALSSIRVLSLRLAWARMVSNYSWQACLLLS